MSWYREKGPESDVVVSSRVRLARNLKDFPFPYKMDQEQGAEVLGNIKESVLNRAQALSRQFTFVDIQQLSVIDRQELVEKHMISKDLAESRIRSGVLISKDEEASIMINEEDHVRIQFLLPGMQMDKAWDTCNQVDVLMEETMDFAFSHEYGYLTSCPTNIGTGIRASAMLHLPALTMTGYIHGVLEVCGKIGVTVRGLYGEHSKAEGNMFQISNQVTLGQPEEEIIANINNITLQIVEQERSLRNELYKQNSFRFEDKVFRSLGLLANARIMSSTETLKLLSDVRVGVDMGIIKGIDSSVFNEIMILSQPASLQKHAGRPLKPDERDIKRAEFIRSKLEKIKE